MAQLNPRDVALCISRLNPTLRNEMQGALAGITVVAGGFIRSVVSGETVNDIDVFVTSDVEVGVISDRMRKADFAIDSSPNAVTCTKLGKIPIQIITRWKFGDNEKIKELRKGDSKDKALAAKMMIWEVVDSFDFTVCQAAIIYVQDGLKVSSKDSELFGLTGGSWLGVCSDSFYEDLCGKRLVYTSPKRCEDAGGSMLRLLKYTARGYRATLDSIAAVAARWVVGMDSITSHDGKMKIDKITIAVNGTEKGFVDDLRPLNEEGLAEVLAKRLVEIDPPIDVSILPYVP